MVIDTSALLAILFNELDAEYCESALDADPTRLISAARTDLRRLLRIHARENLGWVVSVPFVYHGLADHALYISASFGVLRVAKEHLCRPGFYELPLPLILPEERGVIADAPGLVQVVCYDNDRESLC